ncbi:hypothetical protein OS493_033934 [Desmophyllum pertusum]|uniref:Pecanex-like protein n=1 Tax=Desmophyllum pertusum TaxID=174260 RepID=A0A9W9ZWK9_9CNID|nr:hypothetical protein OS493_033934 [Desmophyllum pertusum]
MLGFPLLFLVGLLPQVNTFLMYILEQLDMHAFGGNAITSLKGALWSLLRNLLAVSFLFGFCFGAMQHGAEGGQHVLFSVFSGLLVAISYHLSRSASDPTVLGSVFKKAFGQEAGSDNDEEFVDPLPEKLRATVAKRLQNDIVCCIFILVFVFAIHLSTVFTALQPYVSYVLYAVAGLLGIINHYLWPQLHKPLPWLCFARPFLRSREFNQYEVKAAAKIMAYEWIHVWLNFIERNIIYPAVFLSALTSNASKLVLNFGPYGGPAVICIMGLKLLRSSFSDSSRQHLVLLWTVLFFHFDYGHSSETFVVDYFFMSILMNKLYELILRYGFGDDPDDNKPRNSIFYEHLTRSLQHSLCGDLDDGPVGAPFFTQGDCFSVLASDYLEMLWVFTIIEVGNGSWARTVSSEKLKPSPRELKMMMVVVAVSRAILPNMLSLNAAFLSAVVSMGICKYSTQYSHLRLDQWLRSDIIREQLVAVHDVQYVDIDRTFYHNIDEDYDLRQGGISKSSFLSCYLAWIQYCALRKDPPIDCERDSLLVTPVFCIVFVGETSIGDSFTSTVCQPGVVFIRATRAVSKETSESLTPRTSGCCADMDLLRKVVAPGVTHVTKTTSGSLHLS